ncbi:hypothetical protein E4U54_001382 [Claviceps lovelessii]|nr:hypothetical protein E4U54_001382 [Claviceps lovelessii]
MKRLRDQPPEAEINDGPIFSLRELLRPEWVVPHRCLPWVTDFSVAASPRAQSGIFAHLPKVAIAGGLQAR